MLHLSANNMSNAMASTALEQSAFLIQTVLSTGRNASEGNAKTNARVKTVLVVSSAHAIISNILVFAIVIMIALLIRRRVV